MATPSFESRFRGGILGAAAGDALGLPVEFESRAALRNNPVTGLREGGTYGQPRGTWSDDTSMTLCLLQGLTEGRTLQGIGRLFEDWLFRGLWTPHGQVFDVGTVTREALSRLSTVADPAKAGDASVRSNGNGSLMRTLPVALMRGDLPVSDLAALSHDISSITHAHARSRMACGIACAFARHLLLGEALGDAWDHARLWAADYYSGVFPHDLPHIQDALQRSLGDWRAMDEAEIGSSGYVLHTLEASLWCVLTTPSYSECVLRAVNLGFDTDTTAAVAGGLAGVHYGVDAIPADWRDALARRADIEDLIARALAAARRTA